MLIAGSMAGLPCLKGAEGSTMSEVQGVGPAAVQ